MLLPYVFCLARSLIEQAPFNLMYPPKIITKATNTTLAWWFSLVASSGTSIFMTSQRSRINIPKAKYVGKRYLSSLSQSPLTLACQRLNLKVLKEIRQSVTTICILLKQFGLGIQTDFNYRAVSHILSAPLLPTFPQSVPQLLTYRHQFFQPPKEHPTATKRRVRTGSKRCKDGGAG